MNLLPGGCDPPERLCYFSSSTSTRTTSATTNRQSTAIVISTRIQDDFSSMASPPFIGPARRPQSRLAGRWPIVLSQFQRSRFRTLKEAKSRLVLFGTARQITNGVSNELIGVRRGGRCRVADTSYRN